MATTSRASPLVDVHTHMYPPAYMDMLRQRASSQQIPFVVKNHAGDDRLVILPNEKACEKTGNIGRPIGAEYFDFAEKIAFMDRHAISHSVVSVANPWLDFLDAAGAGSPGEQEQVSLAVELNRDLEKMCRAEG